MTVTAEQMAEYGKGFEFALDYLKATNDAPDLAQFEQSSKGTLLAWLLWQSESAQSRGWPETALAIRTVAACIERGCITTDKGHTEQCHAESQEVFNILQANWEPRDA